MSILILGDCHLGKGAHLVKSTLGQNISSRVQDQENLLNFTLNKAIELNVSDLILTGDIFEEPKPDQSLINIFLSWLKFCSLNKVNVHIIRGNHDVLRTANHYTSPLDIIETAAVKRVFIHKDIDTIFVGNLGVTLMPFRDRKSLGAKTTQEAKAMLAAQLVYQLSNIPRACKKLVVGHMALEGSMYIGDEISDITNEIMCGSEMFEGYDYVLMGHVHTPQVLTTSPYIAHVGSMDQSNFSETEDKILVHFHAEPKEIPLPTRKMKNIDLQIPNGEDATDYTLSELDKLDLKDKIVRVKVSSTADSLPLRKTKVLELLTKKGVFCTEGVYESRKSAVIRKEQNKRLDTKIQVPDAIVEFANKNIAEPRRSAFIELSKSIFEEL
jgi:DNA repair exonuclease SbcCD nuclease subunit